MVPDDAGTILIRLLVSSPLLFIGLSMAIDPAGFLLALTNAAQGIRGFERHLRGIPWYEPSPEAGHGSARTRAAARFVGIVLSAWTFLYVVGVV
jgi:hypothetical protein